MRESAAQVVQPILAKYALLSRKLSLRFFFSIPVRWSGVIHDQIDE